MLLRTLALLVSITGMLYSGMAAALGLGEITLKSQFNQPLNAEIRLLQVRDLSEEEVLVGLASREDFQRAGVDRLFFLTGLEFEVVLDNPSNPHIRVTTRKPVTEPYLDFLIEVQWPSGRLLREYTLLLDLPVFTEAAPSKPAVSTPASSTPGPAAVSSPAPSSAPVSVQPAPTTTTRAPASTATPSRPPAPTSTSVDSYRVQRGDTLWEIAERVRPDASLSVNQTMIAIQRANPGAFIDGNINRLRNGRVLRVPDSREIANISYNEAVAAVRQQNQSWNSAQKAVLTSAAPTRSTGSSSSSVEGRLTLGSADDAQGDSKGAGTSGSGESLQNDLAITQEELSRAQRENTELQSRVAELEEQIETMEKLVQVTNDQLKALQTATENQPSEATASAVASDSSTIDQQSESTQQDDTSPADTQTDTSTDSAMTEAPSAESAPVQPPVTAESPSTPVTQAPEKTEGILDILKRNMLVIGGGILALIVAIFVILRLREKPEHANFDDFDMGEEEDLFTETDHVQPDEMDLDAPLAEEEIPESVEAETEDVVAEADIYVSLGQEDKAIELLQKEISENPDNADARLGLLRIYAKTQNASAFDEQYAQLLPLGNVYANDQATALRKEIDGIEPFDTDNYSPAVAEEDTLSAGSDDLDFDLDLDLEDGESVDTALDLGDVSLDLDDMAGDDFGDFSGDKASEDDSDEFSFDLDDDSFSELDDGLELELDENIAADLESDDLAGDSLELETDLDLDLDLDDSSESELESLGSGSFDISDSELDLDIDDDFASTLDDLAEESSDDELSLSLDEEMTAAEADLASEPDFNLDLADENDSGESLSFDAPLPEDVDLASLDQEIDAMTADLDEPLPLDMPEVEQDSDDSLSIDSSDDLDLDIAETLDISGDDDFTLSDEADDVHALPDDADSEDLDFLAGAEMDSSIDESGDDLTSALTGDDMSVTTADNDVSVSSDDDLDFLEAADEVSTKLDLARAYLDMGDREGAQDILNEVMEEGNDQQKTEAQELMQQV